MPLGAFRGYAREREGGRNMPQDYTAFWKLGRRSHAPVQVGFLEDTRP